MLLPRQLLAEINKQVFDVPQRQRLSHRWHNHHADNVGRRVELTERIIGFVHPIGLARYPRPGHPFDTADNAFRCPPYDES